MKENRFASLNPSSLPGPEDIIRHPLENGIIALIRPNPNSMTVAMAGYLPAGGLYEPEEKLGLANFTAEALMRGTSRRTFEDIYEGLESMGASLSFSGGTHTAGFAGKSLANDLETLLDILADTLRNPVFPEMDLEKLRHQFLIGLDLRSQDTSEMASLTFDQVVFANHPYRHPEDGYPETVSAVTREDLVHFHDLHYGPEGTVIALAGAVQPQAVIDTLERILGDWQNPRQPEIREVPDADPLKERIRKHHVIEEKSQTDIVMGSIGPSRQSPAYMPARLGNSVLGQFGMMGRIGEAVRNRAGYAYYAYSSISSSIGPGTWTVSAGVDPKNLDQAIDLIQGEIERFVQEPVAEDELSDSQSSYIGKLPLALESNAGVAGSLLNIERHQLGLDYFQRYEQTIREVTSQDILETARQYLDPKRLAIATAGPKR